MLQNGKSNEGRDEEKERACVGTSKLGLKQRLHFNLILSMSLWWMSLWWMRSVRAILLEERSVRGQSEARRSVEKVSGVANSLLPPHFSATAMESLVPVSFHSTDLFRFMIGKVYLKCSRYGFRE